MRGFLAAIYTYFANLQLGMLVRDLQMCMFLDPQIANCKFASLQGRKPANLHLGQSTSSMRGGRAFANHAFQREQSVCKFDNFQLCRPVSSQVCEFASFGTRFAHCRHSFRLQARSHLLETGNLPPIVCTSEAIPTLGSNNKHA